MRWLVYLCVVPVLTAQPMAVRVAGSTPTQILLSYQSPDLGSCSLAATNVADPATIVYDLDSGKFPGANLDTRHEWNAGVRNRVVVVGRRTSEKGSDGRLYSRALEADANYSISITCGGETVTVETSTDWVPAGDLFPENPPFNLDGVGNYAWPTIDWLDRNRPYIDPMTGIKIKFATFPGDWANRSTGKFGTKLWADLSPSRNWLDPQNAGGGVSSTLSTYVGGGQEPLFVGVDPTLTNVNRLYGGWGGGELPWSTDDLGVHVIGRGTDSAEQNRTVSICLTIDSGQSCYTDSLEVVLPLNTAADTGVRPANFPSPMFAGWGKPVGRVDLPTRGTVDVSGQVVTLKTPQNGAGFFNPALASGSKIHLPGSAPACDHDLCTILEVQDATHLLVRENVELSGVTATIANFGVRVVKTTSTGSVSLTLTYENAWSFPVTMPVTGNTEMCGTVPVFVNVTAAGAPLPNGQVLKGYNCAVGGSWYWISTDTGESRLISITNPPAASEFAGWAANDLPNLVQSPPGVAAFDNQNPNVAYTYALLDKGGKALFQLTYTGDYRALNYKYPVGGGGEQPKSVRDSVQWTNLSPASQAKDPTSQVRTLFPAYDVDRFGGITDFRGVSGDYAMFLNNLGGQDTGCWVFLFNIRTQVLEHTFNTWDGAFDPFLRWQACHFGGAGSIPNTATIANRPMYSKSRNVLYGGPFEAPVTGILRENNQFDSNTTLAADADGSFRADCPAGLAAPYAELVGTSRCVTILVSGEPCSSFATDKEIVASPCPWDNTKSMLQTMEVGDYVADSTGNFDQERMIIVRKTPSGSGAIELVLYRFEPLFCGTLSTQRKHTSGWRMQMVASGPDTCEGGFFVLDIPNRKIHSENRRLLAGHFDLGMGAGEGLLGFVGIGDLDAKTAGDNRDHNVYAIRENMTIADIGKPATGYVEYDPTFSGVRGLRYGALQSYVSKHQWDATGENRTWALDFRHLNGSYGFALENIYTTLGAVATTRASSTNVFQLNILGDTNVKKIPLLGYAGRFLLKEKSSPTLGDTLTDADAYRFCYAYKNGECRHGSTAGQAFVSIPAATPTGYCQSSQLARNIPCLMTPHPMGAWAIQFDTTRRDLTGSALRKLTMGFMGPGRQYAYGNLRALPDGRWAMMSGWWIDGLRHDILLVKVPALHTTDTDKERRRSVVQREARGDFVPLDISVPPMSGAAQAVVEFGYEENGRPDAFRCTPREDVCRASSATIHPTEPFLYASEGGPGAACSTGCTIRVPALAARVLYYQVRYLDANGQSVGTSPLHIRISSEERFPGRVSVASPADSSDAPLMGIF